MSVDTNHHKDHKSTWALDELGKIGGVFGVFFFLQSYGYSEGAGVKAPSTVFEAVSLGVQHLSHFLLPFSEVAWPLGPTVCGFLVLYSVYLPVMLRVEPSNKVAKRNNSRFAAVAITISLTIVSGFIVSQTWGNDTLTNWQSVPSALRPPFYAGGVMLLFWAVNTWVVPFGSRIGIRIPTEKPWPEMVSGLLLAWFFLLAYLGSEFDGRLDALSGVFAR